MPTLRHDQERIIAELDSTRTTRRRWSYTCGVLSGRAISRYEPDDFTLSDFLLGRTIAETAPGPGSRRSNSTRPPVVRCPYIRALSTRIVHDQDIARSECAHRPGCGHRPNSLYGRASVPRLAMEAAYVRWPPGAAGSHTVAKRGSMSPILVGVQPSSSRAASSADKRLSFTSRGASMHSAPNSP